MIISNILNTGSSILPGLLILILGIIGLIVAYFFYRKNNEK